MRNLNLRICCQGTLMSLLTGNLLAVGAATVSLKLPPNVSGSFPIRMEIQKTTGKIEGFGRVEGMYLYNVNQQGFAVAPATLNLKKDALLDITLRNALPCNEPSVGMMPTNLSNMHTHGMIVPPTNPKGAKSSVLDFYSGAAYGDFALVTGMPQPQPPQADCPSAHAHGAFPMEKGQIHYRIHIPEDHPDGLGWYHPHMHGTSGTQLGWGLSGLIKVGDFWNYAYVKCSTNTDKDTDTHDDEGCEGRKAKAAEIAQRAKVDMMPLVLKDFQIERPQATAPWRVVLPRIDPQKPQDPAASPFDPAYCGDNLALIDPLTPTSNQLHALSATCSPPRADNPTTTDANRKWLFTVNGQLLPSIQVAAGRHHVWQIANMSANVTHRLQVLVVNGNEVIPVPVQIISNDGVAISQTRNANTLLRSDLRQAIHGVAEPLLAMPASRLEVLVDRAAVCRGYAALGKVCPKSAKLEGYLVSYGMKTGTEKADGSSAGDTWPDKVLAKVSFAASITALAGDATDADFGLSVVSSAMEKSRQAHGYSPTELSRMSQLTCAGGASSSTLDAQHYRLIGLQVTDSDEFKMATASLPTFVLDRGATRLPKDVGKFADADYGSFDMTTDKPSLCVGVPDIFGKRKYQEIWLVRNDSREIHNFHLHQTKFEVLDVKRKSDYETVNTAAGSRPLLNLAAPGVGKYMDTYPVDVDGVIMVRVTFDHPEQLGTYVYHCHILEHEDKGMMSLIQVVNLNKH